MLRLEELTYDEASQACAARGGRLANVRTVADLNRLREFSGNQWLGIGLRDSGAYSWHFDGADSSDAEAAEAAIGAVAGFEEAYGKDCKRTGCILMSPQTQRKGVTAIDCNTKNDWVCEGTYNNTLSESDGIVALGDLLADEGSFCLWHYREPYDMLPNDEGNGFRNTDLACALQVSSRSTSQ